MSYLRLTIRTIVLCAHNRCCGIVFAPHCVGHQLLLAAVYDLFITMLARCKGRYAEFSSSQPQGLPSLIEFCSSKNALIIQDIFMFSYQSSWVSLVLAIII